MSVGSIIALATERIVEPVEGMHRAITGRWFSALGAFAGPARRIHDGVANTVYGSVRVGGAVAGLGLDHVRANEDATSAAHAFVNGLWGDELGRHEDRLGISMGIRDRHGVPVTIGPELGAAFPAATGKLVVLAHGLTKTETCWRGTEQQPGLIGTLHEHPDLTPISIRYNTGLRISDNGIQLSALLEELRINWPVPVQSIALVGHSMGGLVIRSACVEARAAGHGWIDDVKDVVALASPHRGAPLEKFVNVVSWGLGIAPETRPLADFLNRRSVGIKDLRFGAIVEDDWKNMDPDALLRNDVGDHSLTPDIDHHFVAGVITSDPAHPVGVAMGDLMVRTASSTGEQRLEPTNVAIVGSVSHFDLLHDPRVIDSVMAWITA